MSEFEILKSKRFRQDRNVDLGIAADTYTELSDETRLNELRLKLLCDPSLCTSLYLGRTERVTCDKGKYKRMEICLNNRTIVCKDDYKGIVENDFMNQNTTALSLSIRPNIFCKTFKRRLGTTMFIIKHSHAIRLFNLQRNTNNSVVEEESH